MSTYRNIVIRAQKISQKFKLNVIMSHHSCQKMCFPFLKRRISNSPEVNLGEKEIQIPVLKNIVPFSRYMMV